MMSPGRGEWDWLATCHCGEDGGSGRGHDVISLSSSYTPAMIPKVVLPRWGVRFPAVVGRRPCRPVEKQERVLVFSSLPSLSLLEIASSDLASDISIDSSALGIY